MSRLTGTTLPPFTHSPPSLLTLCLHCLCRYNYTTTRLFMDPRRCDQLPAELMWLYYTQARVSVLRPLLHNYDVYRDYISSVYRSKGAVYVDTSSISSSMPQYREYFTQLLTLAGQAQCRKFLEDILAWLKRQDKTNPIVLQQHQCRDNTSKMADGPLYIHVVADWLRGYVQVATCHDIIATITDICARYTYTVAAKRCICEAVADGLAVLTPCQDEHKRAVIGRLMALGWTEDELTQDTGYYVYVEAQLGVYRPLRCYDWTCIHGQHDIFNNTDIMWIVATIDSYHTRPNLLCQGYDSICGPAQRHTHAITPIRNMSIFLDIVAATLRLGMYYGDSNAVWWAWRHIHTLSATNMLVRGWICNLCLSDWAVDSDQSHRTYFLQVLRAVAGDIPPLVPAPVIS